MPIASYYQNQKKTQPKMFIKQSLNRGLQHRSNKGLPGKFHIPDSLIIRFRY
jgi:hypothetical protein